MLFIIRIAGWLPVGRPFRSRHPFTVENNAKSEGASQTDQLEGEKNEGMNGGWTFLSGGENCIKLYKCMQAFRLI